jgi:hypothetical protein
MSQQHVVDFLPGADFETITEAIAVAQPGDRILIRPGIYRESLTVCIPLELIGDGQPGSVIIEASGSAALEYGYGVAWGRIASLTLRQLPAETYQVGVELGGTRVLLEDCEIVSHGDVGLLISGCSPVVRRCQITGARKYGVMVNGGTSVFEECLIVGNPGSGLWVWPESRAKVRRCRIAENGALGIQVGGDDAMLWLEASDVCANRYSNVYVHDGARAALRRNRIHDSLENGVWIQRDSRLLLEGNELYQNGIRNLLVSDSSCVIQRSIYVMRRAKGAADGNREPDQHQFEPI